MDQIENYDAGDVALPEPAFERMRLSHHSGTHCYLHFQEFLAFYRSEPHLHPFRFAERHLLEQEVISQELPGYSHFGNTDHEMTAEMNFTANQLPLVQ